MFDLITGREKHLTSHGDVMEVRFLRSANVPFILTVTLSFSLEAPR
jgi:hypothetical protein